MRHSLPTLPCDLREYARIHTGPESWSARSDDLREVLNEPDAMRTFLDDEPLASVVDGPLIDVRRCDTPRKMPSAAHAELLLDERERRVLGCIDGASSLGTILDRAELAEADVLEALRGLCLRGIVAIAAPDGSLRALDDG